MIDWRRQVLEFWFGLDPRQWWKADPAFDHRIKEEFLKLWAEKRQLPADAFLTDPLTALAGVILFDQFPRNMFRGQARTYETDAVARAVADRALERGFDREVPQQERQFFYLPLMHSETLADQERCLELARGLGDDEVTKYAEVHADIIRRFGRFPHRNAMLGRTMAPDEQAFLDAGGFAG